MKKAKLLLIVLFCSLLLSQEKEENHQYILPNNVSNEQKYLLNKLDYKNIENKDTKINVSYKCTIGWLFAIVVLFIIFAYWYHSLRKLNKELRVANNKINITNIEKQYLIDTTMEAILIFYEKLCIDCNISALKLFGFENKNNLTSKHIFEFISSSDIEIMEKNLLLNNIESYEMTALGNDGKEIPVLVKSQNYKTKEKEITIVIMFDLSEIKEKSNKLKIANGEIILKQQELYELNQTLENKIQLAVEENLLKDKLLQQQMRLAQMGELISMIAHQWRQPLASIASTTIAMRLKLDLQKHDLNTPIGRDKFIKYIYEQVGDIEKFSQLLNQTIDDFRNFYKPNKKLNLINIKEVIQKALDIIEISIANNAQITIVKDYRSNKKIYMHQNEIMQVILNILKNAEDNFREKNIQNKIITITTEDIANGIKLDICDNGGGICDDYIDKIFEPYFSTKSEQEGTGLGLYMSKLIICENHKGDIRVTNKNGGACFTIRLYSLD